MRTTEHQRAPLARRLIDATARARFRAKVTPDGECVRWIGARDTWGYGNFHVNTPAGPRTVKAHQAAYLIAVGELPAGKYLLHACDHPWCVNPAHLRPGTNSENIREAYARNGFLNQNSRKTHCKNGHPFDEANTCRSRGHRECRACRRRQSLAYRRRRTGGAK